MFRAVELSCLLMLMEFLSLAHSGQDPWANFENFVTNQQQKNSFKIQADENVVLNLGFSNRRHNAKLTRTISKQPEYFLNFQFNNYRNPKPPKEEEYKHSNIKFPLKAEDAF